MTTNIKAAFVTREYTPELGIPFGRLGVNRLLPTGVHSPLVARLALFASDDGMAGVLALDQNRIRPLVARELRNILAEATGAPPEAFSVAATHTHNAPILVPWRTDDPSFTMLDRLRDHVAELARKAMTELQAVKLHCGQMNVPGLAGCRRPVYRADDGREQVGTGGPGEGTDFIRMESPNEEELRVVFALDASGNCCGGIVNFPCHPVTMYSKPLISADYPGEVCRRLEAHFGQRFVFITGPAGDQKPLCSCEEMGESLANAALDLQSSVTPCNGDGVSVTRRVLSVPRRGFRPEQIECAAAHLEVVSRGERPEPLAPRLYGYAWHFRANQPMVDDWLAREVMGLWEVQRRSETRCVTEDVEVHLISVGGLRILALPGEPFGVIGRVLRDKFPALLVSEQSNGHAGYLPGSVDAFERGGYECCTAQQSRLVHDAGPRLLKAAEELLGTEAIVK